MHYLMTPMGSAGDNYPFVGLGVELARRGHRVTVVTNDHFAPVVRGSGLGFVSLGTDEEYLGFLADPEIWHPKRGLKTIMSLTAEGNRRMFATVERFAAEDGPENIAVVAHTLDFASRSIAEKRGLAVVTVHLSPSVVRTVHDIGAFQGTRDLSWLPPFVKRGIWWMADRFVLDPAAGPVANEMRAKAGLPPVTRVFTRALHSPRLTVGMWPAWFSAPQPDYPPFVRQTGFPLFDASDAQPVSAEVEAYLCAGEPPVVYTAGTANLHAHAFFAAAVEGAKILGRRTMLLSRFDEHVPADLPPAVTRFAFAPLSKMLHRCAALVHHGGIGTTAAALAAGVPQLIMPMSHDQPNNAHWVTKMRTGGRLMPKKFTGASVAAILRALLSSAEVKAACAAAAARCRGQDAIAETVDLIERAVGPGSGSPTREANSAANVA